MSDPIRQKNSFYIGWQEQAPPDFARASRRFIALVLAVSILTAVLLVFGQRGFADSVFELGRITAHEGILVKAPAPMLKIQDGKDANGKPLFKSILLIGFGKKGAEATLAAIEADQGQALEGRAVQLKGTLIYYDGKTALELTEGKDAFGGFLERPAAYAPEYVALGDVRLRGEILDPKCALGVMKPGYGKPHRSCAVRCISGGIPPVLRITNKAGETNYCIVFGENGQPANSQLLEYLADQVQLCGRLERQDDWLVLYTNPETDIYRLKPYWMEGDVPLCGE